jgi:hypothetical protein
MNTSHRFLIIAISGVFVAGAACGVLFQRYIGLGNALRAAGIWPPVASAEIEPTPTRPPRGIPTAFQGRLALFVLAGQSNMEGSGELPARQTLHPRAFVFGNDYVWRPASEPVDNPEGQVDPVSRGAGRLGPGLAFATAVLRERPDLIAGLIPCAKGNTSIHDWQRSLSDETLYGSCLKRIRAASPMGELAGVLFFQGEADALDPERHPGRTLSAENYGQMFTRYVEDLRADVGQPTLPIIYAQIGSHAAPLDFVNWDLIQQQQAAVDLPFIHMIMTKDLPIADAVHFTPESYQIIGERFAAAYLELSAAPGD